MFGYVRIDKPNMLIKDYVFYRAFYCGICKAMKQNYGNVSRLLTNYDVTLLAILIHSVKNSTIEAKREACILNPLKKKTTVQRNEILDDVCDVTVLLSDYKLSDDALDKDKRSKIARALFRGAIKKARSRQVAVYEVMRVQMEKLHELEQQKCSSIDRVADTFALMLKIVIKLLLGESYSEKVGGLMYNLGRWIYVADALDDIEKDFASGSYNPFLCQGAEFTTKAQYLKDNAQDVDFLLTSSYNKIKECYEAVESNDYEGMLTNIIWYGILAKNQALLRGEQCPVRHISRDDFY